MGNVTFEILNSTFHRKYDPIIWHRKDALKSIFPNLARVNRKRSYIEAKILKIKEIRNRIAHHEPVWKYNGSLFVAYSFCHELSEAMSQDAFDMLKTVDRFSEIHPKFNLNIKESFLLHETELA